MRFLRFKIVILMFSLCLACSYTPTASAAELNPRLKALLLMSTYGAVGGMLLGTAALAFDARGRSPFIGASLGLYAGILFGSYVVLSHVVKTKWKGDDYYPDTPASPYENAYDQDAYYNEAAPQDQSGFEAPATQRHDPYWLNDYTVNDLHLDSLGKSKKWRPDIYINLLNYQF